jgi:hypothetical protein
MTIIALLAPVVNGEIGGRFDDPAQARAEGQQWRVFPAFKDSDDCCRDAVILL